MSSDEPKTDAIFKVIRRLEGRDEFTDEELDNESFMKAARRDHDTFEKAKGAIELLGTIINGSSNNRIIRAAIVAEMIRTHRHLQNELLMTMLLAFGDLADLATENEARWTDGRNDYAYGLLQKMRAKLDQDFYFDSPR